MEAIIIGESNASTSIKAKASMFNPRSMYGAVPFCLYSFEEMNAVETKPFFPSTASFTHSITGAMSLSSLRAS